jgi:transposase
MANLKNFAGFDVSKKFFDVCSISGSGQQSKQFCYDEKGLDAVVKWLPKNCHCTMEATGPYYLKLAMKLHQYGFTVSVVNPLVIKRFSQMRLLRAKTDKADSKMIAEYGSTQNPPLWEPPAAYILKLQQFEALSHQLQKQRTALLCQKEAFTAAGMEKEVTQVLKTCIAHLEKQLDLISIKTEQLIEQHYQQLLKRLISIPGLGKKTAIMLILLSDGFKKFENYKQLSAYVGLCPRIFESGSSVRTKARICKMGMSKIRAILYVCSWSAKTCNTACKELYERLIAKGKAKRLAMIAVANKLLKQAFAIGTNDEIYNANYSKNICF